MKKYILDLKVKSVERLHERYVLIKLTDDNPLPEMLPGQFVEVQVKGSPSTFLRRPISINLVDYLKSFNVPDLGNASTGLTVKDARRMFEAESEIFQ